MFNNALLLCVKYGLPCLPACKNCCGQSCSNADVGLVIDDVCDTDDDEVCELCEHIVTDDTLEFETPWQQEEIVD